MLQTLNRKILLVASISLALIAVAVVLVISGTLYLNEAVEHLADHGNQQQTIAHFHYSIDRSIAEALSYASTKDAESRDEALQELKDARVSLADILADDTGHEEFDKGVQDKRDALHARRTALLVSVEQSVPALMQAVDQQNSAGITVALNELEEREDDIEAIETDSEELLRYEIGASTSVVESLVQRNIMSAVSTFGLLALLVVLSLVVTSRRIVRPIRSLSTAATGVANGALDYHVDVTSNDEVGDLQRAFNQMVQHLRDQQTTLSVRNAELERSFEAQQQLFATVQQLSTPLLPVMDGVVVLPVVGHIDTKRAEDVMQTLLHGVSRNRARIAILDVTGIAMMDTHVIKLLLQAVQATELLGARVMLAGITAAMAQVIVEQGVELGKLRTYRDLRSAIESVIGTEAQINAQSKLAFV